MGRGEILGSDEFVQLQIAQLANNLDYQIRAFTVEESRGCTFSFCAWEAILVVIWAGSRPFFSTFQQEPLYGKDALRLPRSEPLKIFAVTGSIAFAPSVPLFLCSSTMVVRHFGIDSNHLVWLIEQWGESNRTFHNHSRQHIGHCGWPQLAQQLSLDLTEVLNMAPNEEEARKYERAMLKMANYWFRTGLQQT